MVEALRGIHLAAKGSGGGSPPGKPEQPARMPPITVIKPDGSEHSGREVLRVPEERGTRRYMINKDGELVDINDGS